MDVETGEVIEFYHAELEALKVQIAHEMGYELVDHRLELFGRKLKSEKADPLPVFFSLPCRRSASLGLNGTLSSGRHADIKPKS